MAVRCPSARCVAHRLYACVRPRVCAGGRGRQVIAVAKSSDLVLMVLDAGKEGEKNHRAILEAELECVGLRLNKDPPNIYFEKSEAQSRERGDG